MTAPKLILFVRYPVAGQAKTRLIPALGVARAAGLHKRLAERTVTEMRASGLPIEVRTTGAPAPDFASWLGEDLNYVDQGDGDLGERLARAQGQGPVIFIGSDCPDLSAAHLTGAAVALAEKPAVIGPAEDGGYWLLGLAKRCDWLFSAMAWGTGAVLPETRNRLARHDIEPAMLETLADCDRPDDLARWPWLTS